jgi:hypothetical protein
MEWITESSVIRCAHDGQVVSLASQHWVRVGGSAALVADDPQGRVVARCPNVGPTMKPCTVTLKVAKGYSGLVRVDGHAIVLSSLDGLTDGTVPGTVHYQVRAARQHFVTAAS